MLRFLSVLLIAISLFFSTSSYSFSSEAGAAKENPENSFKDGQLNPEFIGQTIEISGEVEDIKPTSKGFPLFKMNLGLKGIDHIWVTKIVPDPEGGISIGDMMIFEGYISSSDELSPDGEVESITNSKTILLAFRVERPN